MSKTAFLLVPLACAALLGGCGKGSRDVDALDRELLNGASQADPALTSALADQIMVDPALAQQSNKHSVRPADAPLQAPIPPGVDPAGDGGAAEGPTLAELAQMQAGRTAQPGGCYAALDYSHAWANRLPAGIPLPKDAAVSEAAGNDLPGCRARVVSFTSAAPAAAMIRFYVTRTRAAGFDADFERRDGDMVVAGARAADGTAFYLTVAPRGRSGSDVDLVSNNGR